MNDEFAAVRKILRGGSRKGGQQLGEVTTLREAVAELVNDGDSVALEGFTHLIPTAAGHEIIRQERRKRGDAARLV